MEPRGNLPRSPTDPLATAAPAFAAALNGSLRRAGLSGSPARVEVQPGWLAVTGAKAGRLTILPAEVVRLRVGYEETKYGRSCTCRLWLEGAESRALALEPVQRRDPAYGAAVRAFAAAVAGQGRIDRIETGISPAAALFLPVVFGLLFLVAAGISIFLLGNEPWWGRLIAPVVPGLVFALGIHLARSRYWPRPIRTLSDLEPHLA